MAHTEAAQSGSCAGDIYILIHNGMLSSVWFSVSLHFAYIRAFFCVCGCHAALSHVRCVRWSVALVLSETDRASLHMAQYVSNVSVLCAMMDALAIVAEE